MVEYHLRKPPWLSKKIDLRECARVDRILHSERLSTICRDGLCPNMSECFSRGQATFLILGDICTRRCSFCGVKKGTPRNVDPNEPRRVAQAARKLNLRHVVVTSVTRDDLADGGAALFAETIACLRAAFSGKVAVEILVPDFQLNPESLVALAKEQPDIFGHNIETIPRLYPAVRSTSNYQVSLALLRTAKQKFPGIYTKSGIMLGLGETEEEVRAVFNDLRSVECDFLSIGQYLRPSCSHYPVQEYVPPAQFEKLKRAALEFGFRAVESGPYVRSSYLAEKYIDNIVSR